ncbi:MAG TPA: PQQ-dependent sugar dehydrogenase [Bryobacteraceae bacterium]|nr:PQQ-dependent sugar dehydrogenase [Bryobacteraceae bacterium]
MNLISEKSPGRFSLVIFILILLGFSASAQTPTITLPNLSVRTIVSGLSNPTGIAFLSDNDFLVIEKNTGRVKRIRDGVIQATVLDLGVNFASERGLLGIALHPNFPSDPGVFLFWTCVAVATPPPVQPPPTARVCSARNRMFSIEHVRRGFQ